MTLATARRLCLYGLLVFSACLLFSWYDMSCRFADARNDVADINATLEAMTRRISSAPTGAKR